MSWAAFSKRAPFRQMKINEKNKLKPRPRKRKTKTIVIAYRSSNAFMALLVIKSSQVKSSQISFIVWKIRKIGEANNDMQ